MARYWMSDGTVIDTEKASQRWEEDTYWDGHNHISCATGSQWEHQTLYRSRKGRYCIVRTSQWENQKDAAEWVSNEFAVRWLLTNGCAADDSAFPEELRCLVDELTE